MVVKVRLAGLNVIKARGRWYVYFRDGGAPLLKGFLGSRDELDKRLAAPDLMGIYNGRRSRNLARSYPEGTLGGLVQWFENDCAAFEKLKPATKKDYQAAFHWLQSEFDAQLDTITTPALYDVRDRCAKAKWARFADKMISALSSMFSQAVKRKKMATNPCLGMDKAHKADPNANREWFAAELAVVLAEAPREIKTPLMLARFGGLRGQSIVAVGWNQYQDHELTGKCFRVVGEKNEESAFVPVLAELQTYLADLARSSTLVAIRDGGTAWKSEKEMQTRVSHWLRDMERAGKIAAGTTLHGLRVSYAAWWKRNGANNSEVADLLGDKSERMGAHYTRHVDREANVIRAFGRIKDRK